VAEPDVSLLYDGADRHGVTEKLPCVTPEANTVESPTQMVSGVAMIVGAGKAKTLIETCTEMEQPDPLSNADTVDTVVTSEVIEAEPEPLSASVVALPSKVHVYV
jgi:hypothetical protein